MDFADCLTRECEAVNSSRVCPDFKLVNVTGLYKGTTVDERRNTFEVMLFEAKDVKSGRALKAAWAHCGVYLEIKPFKTYSAFSDAEGEPLEKPDGKSPETCGQLIDYAATLMNVQHRTHLFIVEICGDYARFIRWDRAGAVICKQFSLSKKPHLLAAFFRQYSKLSPRERGFDPTARRASPAEYEALQEAVQREREKIFGFILRAGL